MRRLLVKSALFTCYLTQHCCLLNVKIASLSFLCVPILYSSFLNWVDPIIIDRLVIMDNITDGEGNSAIALLSV